MMLRVAFLVGIATAVPRNEHDPPSLQAGATASFLTAKSTELAQRVADDLSPHGTAEPPAVKNTPKELEAETREQQHVMKLAAHDPVPLPQLLAGEQPTTLPTWSEIQQSYLAGMEAMRSTQDWNKGMYWDGTSLGVNGSPKSFYAISGTGFGLVGLCVSAKLGYSTSGEAAAG